MADYLDAFSKPLKAFLAAKLLAYVQASFAQFLINVYFWRLSHDIRLLVAFNVAFAAAHLVSYVLAGRWSKARGGLVAMRVGAVLQIAYLALVASLGGSVLSYIAVVAVVGGVADGMYWASDNLLRFDLTSPDNRLKFVEAGQIAKTLAGALVPLAASLLVVAGGAGIAAGYDRVFIAAAVSSAAVFAASYLIRDGVRAADVKLRLRSSSIRLWKDRNIRLACYSTFLAKAAGALPVLIGLLLFVGSGTELALGGYQTATVLVAVAARYAFGKRFARRHYRRLMIVAGVGAFASTFIVFASQGFWALLAYGILASIFQAMSAPQAPLALDALTMHCADERELAETRVEFITLQELFDGAGRAAGFAPLLLLASFSQFGLVAAVVAIYAVAALASNILIAEIREPERFVPYAKIA